MGAEKIQLCLPNYLDVSFSYIHDKNLTYSVQTIHPRFWDVTQTWILLQQDLLSAGSVYEEMKCWNPEVIDRARGGVRHFRVDPEWRPAAKVDIHLVNAKNNRAEWVRKLNLLLGFLLDG